MLNEELLEGFVRTYLSGKGWLLTNTQKKKGQHDVDITASHPKWRKTYRIEVKGNTKSYNEQNMHNAFPTSLGQILCRMDKGGNNTNKSRYYAIAIPKEWERVYKNKISKMKYGWKLLGLKVFLVSLDGTVEEKPNSYFLM